MSVAIGTPARGLLGDRHPDIRAAMNTFNPFAPFCFICFTSARASAGVFAPPRRRE